MGWERLGNAANSAGNWLGEGEKRHAPGLEITIWFMIGAVSTENLSRSLVLLKVLCRPHPSLHSNSGGLLRVLRQFKVCVVIECGADERLVMGKPKMHRRQPALVRAQHICRINLGAFENRGKSRDFLTFSLFSVRGPVRYVLSVITRVCIYESS